MRTIRFMPSTASGESGARSDIVLMVAIVISKPQKQVDQSLRAG
jgi:hypothetical protein